MRCWGWMWEWTGTVRHLCDPEIGKALLGHAAERAAREAAEARIAELEALLRESGDGS